MARLPLPLFNYRARDRTLQANRWQVIRVTWRQLLEPDALAADLGTILS